MKNITKTLIASIALVASTLSPAQAERPTVSFDQSSRALKNTMEYLKLGLIDTNAATLVAITCAPGKDMRVCLDSLNEANRIAEANIQIERILNMDY